MFKTGLEKLKNLAAADDVDYKNYGDALNFFYDNADELDNWSVYNQEQGSTLVIPTNESWATFHQASRGKANNRAALQQHLLKKNVTPANLYRCCDKTHSNRATVVDDIPVQQTMGKSGLPVVAQVQHDVDGSSITLRKPMGVNSNDPLIITKKPARIAFSVPLSKAYQVVFLKDGILHG